PIICSYYIGCMIAEILTGCCFPAWSKSLNITIIASTFIEEQRYLIFHLGLKIFATFTSFRVVCFIEESSQGDVGDLPHSLTVEPRVPMVAGLSTIIHTIILSAKVISVTIPIWVLIFLIGLFMGFRFYYEA
ncbi:hypothetical protein L9F63_021574, partial [Diploptera punctata]